jgi:predicted MPP superfamily phosphohydrolase
MDHGMSARQRLSWPDRVRSSVGACLSEPLYRLFSLVPQWEFGLSDHEVTRHTHVHGLLAGRRAVHLTDLHLDIYYPRHDRIVDTVSGLQPDWIFITGDLLNVPEGLPHLFRFLARLRETAPVFVTLGNHVAGRYKSGEHTLYINRGLGWSFLPFRWNCPPEIALIEWIEERIQAA